ncbi:MAG: VCBS repeat-containing protein [Planctomycetes bacterium]|nr:VCBS repeat-containing protein [Planctomycetota bacterium]
MRVLSATSILVLSLVGTAWTEELFSSKPIWSSKSANSGGDGIARFIDFDRDGDADFLTSAPNPRRWVLFRNDGGKLAEKPMWESEETTDCDHVDVLDFNHDGWIDLAATHESHCTLYFNHSGIFNPSPDWETGIIANANQIDFGDFDRDGDFDMLMAAGDPVNGVALFENTTGTPSKIPTRKLGHTEYSETAIFADFDSDGDLDIVAGYRAGRLVAYLNSDGAFDNGMDVFNDKQSPWTQRLYWHDLDDDDQPELFCAKGPWGRDGRSLQLVRQDGTATMKVAWQSSPQTAFHGFEFQDVDNDGDLDLIGADYGHSGKVSMYLNDRGKLADTPAWSIKTSGPAHEAVFADIDQDGDLDMAVGCKDQAHIYENLSTERAKPSK